MLITTLIEDHKDQDQKYIAEHGLSLYIEDDDEHILFDTGQTGQFIINAFKMGIDLNQVDKVVISHGHYDHGGGLNRFLYEMKYQGPIYVGSGFFKPKYSKKGNTYLFRGITFTKKQGEFYYIKEAVTRLSPNIDIISKFEITNCYEVQGESYFIKEGDCYQQDNFSDEISLVIRTKLGLVLVVGCSHMGIMNIIHQVQVQYKQPIRGLIGGTHMIEANTERLDETIKYIQKLNLEFIALSHCTGDHNMKRLQEAFGDKFVFNCTGNKIII